MRNATPFFLSIFLGLSLALVSCDKSDTSSVKAVSVPPADKPVQIPRVAMASDHLDQWSSPAYAIETLLPWGQNPAKSDLSLGWTKDALLVRVHSTDTTPIETKDEDLMHGDSLEVFVSSAYGSDDAIRCLASPGGIPDHLTPRFYIHDRRTDAPAHEPLQVAAHRDDKGYVLTMAIPWKNFKHVPQPGDIIGLQVLVHDTQAVDMEPTRAWFQLWGTVVNPKLMQRVQLAEQADVPEQVAAQLQPKNFNDVALTLFAPAELAGKDIVVWSGDRQIATGQMTPGGPEGSTAEILLPRELAKQKDAVVRVTVDGNLLPADLLVPDLAKYQKELLQDYGILANPSVIGGDTFPPIDFPNPIFVRETVGPYQLHVRFFDANWNEVTTPKVPGRYGAIVDFTSDSGLKFTTELTLFKTAKPYFLPKDPYTGITLKFPDAFGIPANVVAQEQWNINNSIGNTLDREPKGNAYYAPILAALQDIAKDPARWRGFGVSRVDNAWWNELHKRLGQPQDYPHLVYLPSDYNKDQRNWPLLLSLHGGGDRGTPSDHANDGVLDYIYCGHPIPMIVVTPVCPENESWDPDKLMHLVDVIGSQYRIDRHRIYAIGGSMGGRGVWDFGATYPDKVAAIVPVFGSENPGIAPRLKNVGVWAFHGSEDPVVYTRYSIDLVHQLNALGNPAKLTIYPGYGHADGNQTGFNPQLYQWLLQQQSK